MYFVTLLAAVFFVAIYARLVQPRSLSRGATYGLLFGLATGITMGYGSYAVMPIPYFIAATWFHGTLVEATLAGVLVGWIVKDPRDSPRSVPA